MAELGLDSSSSSTTALMLQISRTVDMHTQAVTVTPKQSWDVGEVSQPHIAQRPPMRISEPQRAMSFTQQAQ